MGTSLPGRLAHKGFALILKHIPTAFGAEIKFSLALNTHKKRAPSGALDFIHVYIRDVKKGQSFFYDFYSTINCCELSLPSSALMFNW